MGALLDHFRAAGITLMALSEDRLHAAGPLTDEARAAIREQKLAILAELAAANDADPKTLSDDRMRTCGECANLSPGGRCLAAWRGEAFGPGIALSRRYAPTTDVMLRCACYTPGPDDPDRRSGAERWPFLLEQCR